MRLKKYLSDYRPPTLAYNSTEDERSRQKKSYLEWLAHDRGWIATTKPCPGCSGRRFVYDLAETLDTPVYWSRDRQRRARKRWEECRAKDGKPPYMTDADLIVCSACDGIGKVALDKPKLDLERAAAYVEQQRHDLEAVAELAVASLKHRLFWHDFRPIIIRSSVRLPQSIAEYDEQVTAANNARRAFDDACRAAQEARNHFEKGWRTATAEEQLAIINDHSAPRLYQEHDRRRDELQRELWRFGQTLEDLWYRPGSPGSEASFGIIHVGIRGPRRGYARVAPTVSIVIKPGKAPSEQELDALVAGAIAELQGGSEAAELPLVA